MASWMHWERSRNGSYSEYLIKKKPATLMQLSNPCGSQGGLVYRSNVRSWLDIKLRHPDGDLLREVCALA